MRADGPTADIYILGRYGTEGRKPPSSDTLRLPRRRPSLLARRNSPRLLAAGRRGRCRENIPSLTGTVAGTARIVPGKQIINCLTGKRIDAEKLERKGGEKIRSGTARFLFFRRVRTTLFFPRRRRSHCALIAADAEGSIVAAGGFPARSAFLTEAGFALPGHSALPAGIVPCSAGVFVLDQIFTSPGSPDVIICRRG